MKTRPLIVHVIHRLDTGGMERVLLSLINATGDRYRHAVICLAGFGAMREEISDEAVPCISLGKRAGKDVGCYVRLWKVLRHLKPDVVTTYNFGTLDAALVARLAGVRHVVHAEHGRGADDPHGEDRKYRWLRRVLQPCIARFVAVSADLESWLRDRVGIPAGKVVCIPNGIDTSRHAAVPDSARPRRMLCDLAPPGTLLIGTVGRLDAVKDQASLIMAFQRLCKVDVADRLRLVIVGEGAQRRHLEALVGRLKLGEKVRLAGNRDDVPALLDECDIFALSSMAEGIPLTVLEAMAAGLPVVATDVGGVGEAVADGVTGTLVVPSNPDALAEALGRYVEDATLRRQHGRAGRRRATSHFSLAAMIPAYVGLYDAVLAGQDVDQQRRGTNHLAERRGN